MARSKTVDVRMNLDRTLPELALPLDEHVRIVVHPPAAHVLEVASVSFAEDREVLLPDAMPLATEQPGPARIPALEVVAKALIFLQQHPDKRLLIAGHTDTIGSDKDNEELSRQRAANVFLYISGDIEGWAAHCHAHAEVADVQRVLSWVDSTAIEFSCNPGPIDNDMGPQTRAALGGFRNTFEEMFGEGLGDAREPIESDWAAFARLYDQAMSDALGSEEVLARVRGSKPYTEPPAIGLGERYPTEHPEQDDLDSERNRRVELIFLDPSEVEFLSDEKAIEQHLFEDSATISRTWIPVGFIARPDELRVQVAFEDGRTVQGQECRLKSSDGRDLTAVTDANGLATFSGLSRGTCELRLVGVEATDWNADDDGPRPLPAPPDDDDDDHEPVAPNDVTLTPAQRRVLDDDPVEDE